MKQLDLISDFKCSFLVDNDDVMRTSFGGCMTILIVVVSILCMIGFGRDLFNKNNPLYKVIKQLK